MKTDSSPRTITLRFQIGDKVRIINCSPIWNGTVGTVERIIYWEDERQASLKYSIKIVGQTASGSFLDENLELVTEPCAHFWIGEYWNEETERTVEICVRCREERPA